MPHVLERIVHADVDRNDGEVGAGGLVRLLEMRHLLTARNAPRRPELQIHGFLAVQLAEIERLAVDRHELEARRRRSQEPAAGGNRLALRARVGRLTARACGQDTATERHHRENHASHGGPHFAVTSGAPSGTIMTAMAVAPSVELALSPTV